VTLLTAPTNRPVFISTVLVATNKDGVVVVGGVGFLTADRQKTAAALVGGEQHRRASVQIANDNASVETAALSEETIASIFHWLGISFFALGLGVGGEYPLSLASAAETSMVSTCDSTDPNSPSSQQPARITQTNENTMTQKNEPLLLPAAIDSPPRTAEEDAPTNHVRTESWNNQGRRMIECFFIVFCLRCCGMYSWTGRLRPESKHYDSALLQTWQILYCIGTGIMPVVLLTRLLYLEESIAWKTAVTGNRTDSAPVPLESLHRANDKHEDGNNDRKREHVSSRQHSQTYTSWSTYSELAKHYGVRHFAVSASWFLWDVAFYGSKLFQSAFLLALTAAGSNVDNGQSDLVQFAAAAAANAAGVLAGYVCFMDHPAVGRQRPQQWGFPLLVCLGLLAGFLADTFCHPFLVSLDRVQQHFKIFPNDTSTFHGPFTSPKVSITIDAHLAHESWEINSK
jgi:hypothetical protein